MRILALKPHTLFFFNELVRIFTFKVNPPKYRQALNILNSRMYPKAKCLSRIDCHKLKKKVLTYFAVVDNIPSISYWVSSAYAIDLLTLRRRETKGGVRLMQTVTKRDLCENIAKRANNTHTDVKETVQFFLDEVIAELSQGR